MNRLKKEVIDKCLNFASGKKEYKISVTAKAPNFPENLLQGNATEQYVKRCREQGMTYREIAAAWGKSTTRNIGYTIEVIQKKEALYDAWIEFWEEIEPVRTMTLKEVCEKSIPDSIINTLCKNGIVSVEDFLIPCVTMTATNMAKKCYGTDGRGWIAAKRKIFDKIREKIFLTVSIDD